jgi:hypothetical protein
MKNIAIALCVGFLAGVGVGYQWLDGRIAKEQRAALKDQIKETERVTGIAQDLGQALGKEAQARADDRITWNRSLKNAKGKLATCEGGVPRLSADFVWLRNEALFRGEAGYPGRTDGPPSGPGASADEVLENDSENAERWKQCRNQLKAWQKLAKKSGWVK